MTITDTTAPSQTESISFDFELAHPPARVWRALTEPALLAEWLLPTVNYKLERGAAFLFKSPPVGDWDGIVQCRIAEIDPQRKLVYDWGTGDLATVLTLTLTPTPSGTKLSIVQSGFKPEQKRNAGGARYGWKMMGGKLIDLLARTT
jgi:uncharacterized protein YndB with AHSA1/START domain